METLNTLKNTDFRLVCIQIYVGITLLIYMKNCLQYFREDEQVIEATHKASLKLLTSLINKLMYISDDALNALQVAVSLALYSANLYSLPRTEIVAVAGIISSWVVGRFQKPFQIMSQHLASNRMEEIKVSSIQ